MNECIHLIKLYSCMNQKQLVLLSISGNRLDVDLFAFKKSIILMSQFLLVYIIMYVVLCFGCQEDNVLPIHCCNSFINVTFVNLFISVHWLAFYTIGFRTKNSIGNVQVTNMLIEHFWSQHSILKDDFNQHLPNFKLFPTS